MWEMIEYLKQPSLVAQIQGHFGVKDKDENNKDNTRKEEYGNSKTANGVVRNDDYVIENKFWYYLFLIGTNLGDEIFYASFIPFWFWNIDGAVGRRVVLVWTIVMYIGQGVKDIIKWPRPTHPAKRLQKKWAEEYGMPSTHAMDIIAGLILACLLMVPMVPMVDYLDYFWLSAPYSPLILFALSVFAIYTFPSSKHWTSTRGDTTMITSVCAGIHIGAWTNFNLGSMTPYPYPPPYTILWPNFYMLGG
ncbi:hypothetical protein RUM44_012186 [Polyplax serrata]|uniref:Uncharacterized protein n=1 Tax=Polyplax serrata TaxID=468196 RepID=A0ABR1BEC3_POLSC